ncbi:hypothetical protein COU13_00430 [Candidatus Kaiserbacteria bacterium CG10_big_fil_rev_8_21_14_0_10_43_70]|uniref:Uncharacterized protein n=1 Tax=Candidatus Kaiserbacteria bacterium CG10_big_fil_rev_8_21_14_0_10_43_70 TaxID=1974605 RepID=A0A2H0UJE9_9BACT|nr:MAG: hypothetical protein COU13_00430 [Candidatus Kaiserbacteria bacterium CG10_big_fil_rev_8_21_14_0_10_43_70]
MDDSTITNFTTLEATFIGDVVREKYRVESSSISEPRSQYRLIPRSSAARMDERSELIKYLGALLRGTSIFLSFFIIFFVIVPRASNGVYILLNE